MVRRELAETENRYRSFLKGVWDLTDQDNPPRKDRFKKFQGDLLWSLVYEPYHRQLSDMLKNIYNFKPPPEIEFDCENKTNDIIKDFLEEKKDDEIYRRKNPK